MRDKLLEYQYSSLQDFFGIQRAQNKIVSDVLFQYYERRPTISDMLRNAQEYYQEHNPQV
jgi:hypothetical protein